MKQRVFKMKQFIVKHELSAMKVGFDAVLLGAWAYIPQSAVPRVLDVGCGCGIISLMVAQRIPRVQIDAIDISVMSVIEAKENFQASPWSHCLHAFRRNFLEHGGRYNLIVSNPPYFDAGVGHPACGRLVARHAGDLSPVSLVQSGSEWLKWEGHMCFIAPCFWLERVRSVLPDDLKIARLCQVADRPGAQPSRVLLDLVKTKSRVEAELSHLYVRSASGQYTDEYKRLTRDFYLAF